jgi:hypothetical protein
MFWNWTFSQDDLCVRVRSYHIRHHSAAPNTFLWRNYNFSTFFLNVRRIISRLCLIIPCNQNREHNGLDYKLHQESSTGLDYALQPESSSQFVWVYIITRIIRILCLNIRYNKNHQNIGLQYILQPESSAYCAWIYVVTRVCSTFFLDIRCSSDHQ